MFGSELSSPAVSYPDFANSVEGWLVDGGHYSLSELEVCQEIYDVFIHSMGHSRVSLLESCQAIHQHAHTDTPVIGNTFEINFRVSFIIDDKSIQKSKAVDPKEILNMYDFAVPKDAVEISMASLFS